MSLSYPSTIQSKVKNTLLSGRVSKSFEISATLIKMINDEKWNTDQLM